ncbi:hypothetical protein VTK73DRAFT_346 [Phialemonium thermophilum]|uniref:Uncharacterized protein n=1 Tax=Phialemonium thermophilum TaxID=223376 RepID=A0ABR3VVM6_9PEZI
MRFRGARPPNMPTVRASIALVVAAQALGVTAQAAWDADQVNTTMCYWEQLRGAVIRDTVYLDGGYIWWLPGLSDGTYGPVTSDYNPLGLVYTLNFSVPFDTTQNITALFQTISKAPSGGNANNVAPTYYDGAMLANDDEWFLYGGMLRQTAAYAEPYPDDVTSFQAYQYGVQKDGFRPGFVDVRLPKPMTRYLAYGGAANAPSENLAWYFSGMHSPTWGEIFTPSLNESLTAVNVSDTLILLNMTTQQQETWHNETLPTSIHGRANPELVWVPVGDRGILVALGGVVYPEFVTSARQSTNPEASEAQSPEFMSTIDIYDVSNDTWYQQVTQGPGPGALTRGCAVVAPAKDYSSFNIYYYGGYDGLHPTQDFNDDVWVLSLPSFVWKKVATGTAGHGRAGHRCFMPYPDQMMVIGGYTAFTGDSPSCLKGGIIQLFNLSSAQWMPSYDPSVWNNYSVPKAVYDAIGGDGDGGATMTAPAQQGWATPGLSRVFSRHYDVGKITRYYPYTPIEGKNSTNPVYKPRTHLGTPKYLAPVLGTILGLVFVALLVVCIILWRKRRLLRAGSSSLSGTEDSKRWIISWIRGQSGQQHPDNKAPTTTTEETPASPDAGDLETAERPVTRHEMANTYIAELMDTSPPVELQDTGLTPVEIINRHSHFAPGKGGPTRAARSGSSPFTFTSTSDFSSVTQTDHPSSNSLVSAPGGPTAPAPRPTDSNGATSPESVVRPDSPPLGNAVPASIIARPTRSPPPLPQQQERQLDPPTSAERVTESSDQTRGAVLSGVSELSDRDRAHLRQVSQDTTVSSTTSFGTSSGAAAGQTGAAGRGRSSLGTPRRSVFLESEEDLGGRGS